MKIIKNRKATASDLISCELLINGTWYPHGLEPNEEYELSSDSEWEDIKPYTEPVKTLEQLQDEAVSAMASAIQEECRSGTGKLYFSNIESAAMYTSVIQEDAEIRARAEELMLWSFAIDTYALSVVFDIDEGGDIPTIESFIAGLPTI